MDEKISLFKELADLYENNGHSLYMVGGSVRDYILGLPLNDMDLVTDATPEEEKKFLTNADFTFAKYGSIKLCFKGHKFDITTLRKESGYIDSRHPQEVVFTKSLKEDVTRRDFTINALYLSKDLKVIDYVNGKLDIEFKLLRMIGDPNTRLKEDPLRIIRAYRFCLDYQLQLDIELESAITNNSDLLFKIRIEKIKEEIHKCHHKNELKSILNDLGINNL